MHSYQQKLPDQLAAGIRVLMYAGDQDYICNWLGNQAWTKALAWPGKQEFNDAKLVNFTLPGGAGAVPRQAGQLRSAKGFSFLRVYEAGHMGKTNACATLAQLRLLTQEAFCWGRGQCRATSRRRRWRCSTRSSVVRSEAERGRHQWSLRVHSFTYCVRAVPKPTARPPLPAPQLPSLCTRSWRPVGGIGARRGLGLGRGRRSLARARPWFAIGRKLVRVLLQERPTMDNGHDAVWLAGPKALPEGPHSASFW